MKKTPMRMCFSCRQKFDKRELNRVIKTPEDEILFDPSGKKNGRGVYVCTSAECIEKLKSVKMVSAALDTKTDQATLEKVCEQVKEFIESKKVK